MADSMIGRVFSGRYKITERIGIGGMAEVYRAEDGVLGRTVAVKVMLPQYAADPEFAARFRQEAASAANLQSPYIVNIYDWGQDQGTYFIVMEYVHGSDLKTGINNRGAINPRKVAEIGIQVCQALTTAHRLDIIHRDIKPQNIMIQPDGNVKVMDFGIARAKNSLLNTTSSVLGTAHYISPEQAQGKELGAASDIYSLGVVLYEAATGKLPFDGPDAVSVAMKQVSEQPVAPHLVRQTVDPDLEAIIMKAMCKDPRNRFATANEMRIALQAYLSGAPFNFAAPGNDATVVLPMGIGGMPGNMNNAGNVNEANSAPGMGNMGNMGNMGMNGAAGVNGMGAAMSGVGAGMGSGMGSISTDPVTGRPRRTVSPQGDYSANVPNYYSAAQSGTIRHVDPRSDMQMTGRNQAYRPASGGSHVGVVLGIIFAIIFAAAVGLGFWFLASDNTFVPSVVGKTQTEAVNVIESSGYSVGTITQEYSNTVATGRVISQNPGSGTKLDEGGTIDLVISQGVEQITVPDLLGKTVTEAQTLLKAMGLVAVTDVPQYSSTVELNHVISQNPVAGTKISRDGEVSFVLSLGVEAVGLTNVVGQTFDAADALLRAQGFNNIVQEHEYSSTVEKDVVIRQDPIGGVGRIEKDATITLVISDGPEEVDVPSVVGMEVGEATTLLEAEGFVVAITGDNDEHAMVTQQSPAATTELNTDKAEKGSTVTITGKLTTQPDPEEGEEGEEGGTSGSGSSEKSKTN